MSFQKIFDLWQERRRTLREQNVGRARAVQDRILAAMQELGIENLPSLAAAQVREAQRSLTANQVEDALEQARFAAALAPDLPDTHLMVFRTQLAKEPGHPLAALAELWAAIGAASREPRMIRALFADLAGAGLVALALASIAAIALLFVKRLRPLLHDSRHLPLLRAGNPMQAALLTLVLIAAPFVLWTGPLVILFVLAAAVWLYLSLSERLLTTVALASLVMIPFLVHGAARLTAWTLTTAEKIYELEHGSGCGDGTVALLAQLQNETSPPALQAALARCQKRQGDLEGALRLYQRASATDGGSAEIQVNLGNVLFLKGDLEGAKAAYLAATDRATDVTTLAVAHYDLSKLYLRQAAVEQSTEARKKAQLENSEYLDRAGSDDDFRANRWLLDVAVPTRQLSEMAAADGEPRWVAAEVRAALAGVIPTSRWPAVPAAIIALLWLVSLLESRIRPSSTCEKCGRSACHRCDGGHHTLCGQCVNVFQRQGLVEPKERARKEAAVRRYQRWDQTAMRILTLVGGGAGHLIAENPWRGFALLVGFLSAGALIWSWRGLVPLPFGSSYLIAAKLLVAVPLGILCYGVALRDAFRR